MKGICANMGIVIPNGVYDFYFVHILADLVQIYKTLIAKVLMGDEISKSGKSIRILYKAEINNDSYICISYTNRINENV